MSQFKFLHKFKINERHILKIPGARLFGPRLFDHNLWHYNRKSIIRATFIGLGCSFMPIPPHSLEALILAFYIRANIPIAVVITWISTFVTPFLLYMAYNIGAYITDHSLLLTVQELSTAMRIEYQHVIHGEAIDPSSKFSWISLGMGWVILALIIPTIGGLLISYIWRLNIKKRWRLHRLQRENRLKEINKSPQSDSIQ